MGKLRIQDPDGWQHVYCCGCRTWWTEGPWSHESNKNHLRQVADWPDQYDLQSRVRWSVNALSKTKIESAVTQFGAILAEHADALSWFHGCTIMITAGRPQQWRPPPPPPRIPTTMSAPFAATLTPPVPDLKITGGLVGHISNLEVSVSSKLNEAFTRISVLETKLKQSKDRIQWLENQFPEEF